MSQKWNTTGISSSKQKRTRIRIQKGKQKSDTRMPANLHRSRFLKHHPSYFSTVMQILQTWRRLQHHSLTLLFP